RATDLVAALSDIAARGDVDRVVIETTGIADPLALTFVLERPDLAEIARLDAVVTVVDAANWRKTRGAEWDAQVGAADLLVLAQTDLAPDPADPRALLAEINPAARILDGTEVPLEVVLDVERAPHRPTVSAANHSRFGAVSITSTAVHDRNRLEDLLETLPAEGYRAKGVAAAEGGGVGCRAS